jgi:hypothetical protein
MPVRRYRDVSEMEGNTWLEPGDAKLFRAIRAVWELAARTTQPHFPPGVYKQRSIEAVNALEEEWERANFEAFHARRRAKRSVASRPPNR